MNQELKAELAKALVDIVWMKGKISDEERAKSKAIIEEKTKTENGKDGR